MFLYLLHRYDGIVLSVGGNGRSFVLILEAGPSADTSQSKLYFARMSTKAGFCRVRDCLCTQIPKIVYDYS